jgi:hypothetical protein
MLIAAFAASIAVLISRATKYCRSDYGDVFRKLVKLREPDVGVALGRKCEDGGGVRVRHKGDAVPS